jgi:hypothetical protein
MSPSRRPLDGTAITVVPVGSQKRASSLLLLALIIAHGALSHTGRESRLDVTQNTTPASVLGHSRSDRGDVHHVVLLQSRRTKWCDARTEIRGSAEGYSRTRNSIVGRPVYARFGNCRGHDRFRSPRRSASFNLWSFITHPNMPAGSTWWKSKSACRNRRCSTRRRLIADSGNRDSSDQRP